MSGNGHANPQVTIDVEDPGDGWAYIHAGEKEPDLSVLPHLLNDVLLKWMKNYPDRRIVTTQGIVVEGTTVGIHIWYDKVC